MTKTIKMDKKHFEGQTQFIEDNMRVRFEDAAFVEDTVKGYYDYVATTIGENLKDAEVGDSVIIKLPDYIEFKGVKQEDEIVIGITAHAEIKKRIKSDDQLEELEESEEE